jgi:hypothetical protein
MVDQEINVMDFIFEDLYYAVMDRKVPPYAPYVMKLIVHSVKDQGDLLEFADIHTYGTLRIKQEQVSPLERAGFAAQQGEDPVWTSTLSRDMLNKQVKKVSWFQKISLCMNVQIHKENYAQYRQTRKVQKQNQEIIKNHLEYVNDACRRAGEPSVPLPQASQSSSTIPYAEYYTHKVQ